MGPFIYDGHKKDLRFRGALGVKTPPSTKIFFNLPGFFEKKNPKTTRNFQNNPPPSKSFKLRHNLKT